MNHLIHPPGNYLVILVLLLLTSFTSCQSSQLVNGWEQSQSSYDETLMQQLYQSIADTAYKDINSIIVIQDGKLLIEQYFNGASRNSTHNPRSVGKTIASAMLGIAIDEGHIKGLSETLDQYYDLKQYDHYSEKKSQVQLKHLLTMTSGFEGYDFDMESIGNEEYMYDKENWVKWTLDLPMATDRNPGDKWYYFTAGIVVLGDILHQSVPGGLEAYTEEKFFKPLGIKHFNWQYTPQGVANTAGGLQLTPLGFAKFGQLYKNKGRWGDQQILPEAWATASIKPMHQTTMDTDQYGYLWWHKNYEANGKSYPVSYCSGNGGNKIFVFQDQPWVIVITASAYNRRYAHPQVDEMMKEYILPALTNQN